MTRPHCNLSRATAAALVAPAGPVSSAEIRCPRTDLLTTSNTSGRGKLEAVLTAVKEPVTLESQAAADNITATAVSENLLAPSTATEAVAASTDEVDEAAICEVFESEAVFPRPSSSTSTLHHHAEVETSVEEFLEEEEGEELEDDGDESAMLCRAHESALLKAAEVAAAEAAVSQKAANIDNAEQKLIMIKVEGEEKTKNEEQTVKVEAESTPTKEEIEGEKTSSLQTQSAPQECCDSPPPIVAHVREV